MLSMKPVRWRHVLHAPVVAAVVAAVTVQVVAVVTVAAVTVQAAVATVAAVAVQAAVAVTAAFAARTAAVAVQEAAAVVVDAAAIDSLTLEPWAISFHLKRFRLRQKGFKAMVLKPFLHQKRPLTFMKFSQAAPKLIALSFYLLVCRGLRARPASALSNSAFGSRRSSLATTPICQGITR